MQPKEVAGVSGPGIVKESVKVPAASRGVDPLMQSAVREIAVVVNRGG